MGVGFGVLGLSPAVLWSMTLAEFEAAVRGRLGPGIAEPPSRHEVEALEARFPDFRVS